MSAQPSTTDPAGTMRGATISVVVTTCTAHVHLRALLTDLAAQSRRPHELLVVDNRPATSGVRDLLGGSAVPPVRYVAEPRRGLSRARNAGLAAATGELVVFTDDDVDVPADWLARLAEAFSDRSVACVSGLILPRRVDSDAERWFEEFGGYAKGYQARRFTLESAREDRLYPYRAGRFGSGANLAFRRSVLVELGGFADSLGAGTHARGGEDLDIFLTVLRAGYTLVYQPAARLTHPSHTEYRALRRQLFGYGVGLAAALTRRFLVSAADRREMVRTAPAALRYLLSPTSGKNRGRSDGYPRMLVAAELAGVLLGPPCYLRSALAAPRGRWRQVREPLAEWR